MMQTVLVEEAPNPRFRDAWKYVVNNYAYLFRDTYLRRVSLLNEENHHPGADGLHSWYSGNPGVSHITIRNGQRFSTAYFVELLVHELTHLAQCSSGRFRTMTTAQMEAEAYPAGKNARALYEMQQMESDLAELNKAVAVARMKRRWTAA